MDIGPAEAIVGVLTSGVVGGTITALTNSRRADGSQSFRQAMEMVKKQETRITILEHDNKACMDQHVQAQPELGSLREAVRRLEMSEAANASDIRHINDTSTQEVVTRTTTHTAADVKEGK